MRTLTRSPESSEVLLTLVRPLCWRYKCNPPSPLNISFIVMQKILNVLTVISFGAVTFGTAVGVYVYTQRDNIVENVKSQVTKGVKEALPGLIQSALDIEVPISDEAMGVENPVSLPVVPF